MKKKNTELLVCTYVGRVKSKENEKKKRKEGNLYVNNTQEIQENKKNKIAGIKFKKAHDQEAKNTHMNV